MVACAPTWLADRNTNDKGMHHANVLYVKRLRDAFLYHLYFCTPSDRVLMLMCVWGLVPRIPDSDAVKPDDWDEDAPQKIPDPNAEKPDGWLDDGPEYIPDPDADMPEDWYVHRANTSP